VKWCSIKVNVRFSLINGLRYLTFSSVRAVFGRPLPGFRSVADQRSSTRLQIVFTEQSFQPFFRKFCNNCSVSKAKFPLCLDPTFIFIRYFTHNQSYRPNCVYDLKYWRIYYNAIIAMLHVNIKIRTSQQRCSCCSVTLIIKSTFCSVVKFVLEVSVSVNLTYVK